MTRTELDRKIAAYNDAQSETESRLVYRSADPIMGDDSGRRTEALLERMERKLDQRRREMIRICVRHVTGFKCPEDWYRDMGAGPRNGYTPTIHVAEYGNAAHFVSMAFKTRYGREANVVG